MSESDNKGGLGTTHHVKKLLDTYMNTAGRTLTGPANSSLENDSYSGRDRRRSGAVSYKLPPDVELSKTVEDDPPPASSSSKEYYMQQQQQQAYHHQNNDVKAEKLAANGMVTLSRIDDHGPSNHSSVDTKPSSYHSSSSRQRNNSGDSSHSHHSSHHGHHAQIPPQISPHGHAHPLQSSPSSGEIPYHMMARHQDEIRRRQQQQPQVSPRQQLPSPVNKGNISVINFDRLTAAQEKYIRTKNAYPGPQISPGNGSGSTRPPPAGAIPAPHQFKRPSTGQQQNQQNQPPPPLQHVAEPAPVLSPRDAGQSELRSTILNGENIACFYVGGEARLCLPQILNTVLDSLSLHSIYAACDELQIYCSTCSKNQLTVLKQHKILPVTAYQCGLITKSDAERLSSTLLENKPPLAPAIGFDAKKSPFSFKVEHNCFGHCEGILLPEACLGVRSRCIECKECEGVFTPVKFVSHAHGDVESRTCHWGFDSANWKSYLRLSEEYDRDPEREREKIEKRFAEFKARYTVLQKREEQVAAEAAELAGPAGPVSGPAERVIEPHHVAHAQRPQLAPPSAQTSIMAAIANIHGKRKQSDDSPLSRASSSASGGSQQQGSPGLPIPPAVKKSRLSTESGDGYQSGSPSQSTQQYNNMYMYQTMMTAMKAGTGPNGGVHPAAAQWMNTMTQAMKDGKIPAGMFPPPPPGSGASLPHSAPVAASSSSYNGNGRNGDRSTTSARSPTPTKYAASVGHVSRTVAAPVHHGENNGRRRSSSSPGIKATGGNGQSIHERSPSTNSVPPPSGSPTSEYSSSKQQPSAGAAAVSSSSTSLLGGRGSLAEDIHFIKDAISGASSQAREQTLKILERLTARLALAESERDSAMSNFTSLQKRYHGMEEQLSKKRAELRELLHQETAAVGALGRHQQQPCDSPPPPTVSSEPPPTTLHLRTSNRPVLTTLDLLAESRGHAHTHNRRGPSNANFATGLPKVDLKTPARLISEEQQRVFHNNSSGSTRSSERATPGMEEVPSTSTAAREQLPQLRRGEQLLGVAQRHRSGTPSSTKSKDSNQEELQNRMEFLEGEVQFLREALIRKKELETKQQREKEEKQLTEEKKKNNGGSDNGHAKSNGNGTKKRTASPEPKSEVEDVSEEPPMKKKPVVEEKKEPLADVKQQEPDEVASSSSSEQKQEVQEEESGAENLPLKST